MQDKCEVFAKDGLSNIFEGALVAVERTQPERIVPYRVIGYRLESSKQSDAFVICRSKKDSKGIYRGTLHFKGARRKARAAGSLFFPKHWSREKVIEKICEARRKENFISAENGYHVGNTSEGIKIALWINEDDKIYDAMPLSDESLGKKKSPKALCKLCGEPKYRVCSKHHNFPRSTIRSMIYKKAMSFLRKCYFGTRRKLRLVD